MKKILLITFLFAISYPIFANMQQTGWRWRADNGNETSATWLAADTTGITISDTTTIIRLRVRIDNAGGNGDKTTTGLGYSASPIIADKIIGNDTLLKSIPDTWDGKSPFIFVSSSNVADSTPTTSVPILYVDSKTSDEKPDWKPGLVQAKNRPYTLSQDFHTEVEYCIKPTKYIKAGTYYFLPGGGEIEIYPAQNENMAKLTFVDLSSSVNSASGKLTGITVSPNPASDHIVLSNLPKNSTLSIVNLSGQVVKKVSLTSSANSAIVPVTDLQKGLYIVEVSSDGKTVRQKIVKD